MGILVRVHQFEPLVLSCADAKKALAFPTSSFSFSSWRTRRHPVVISASVSRGSGRPSRAAWRRSRSGVTHRPATDSPSRTSWATDAIEDPVSDTRAATSRRYSGVKRRRERIPGTSLSAGTHTRFTKYQQHQPKPTQGLVTPIKLENGIEFTISDTGQDFVAKLSSQYFNDYKRALNPMLTYVDSLVWSGFVDRVL